MKLEIDDISIVNFKDRSCVRISMGGYMFMDTPFVPTKNIGAIHRNIMQRIEK